MTSVVLDVGPVAHGGHCVARHEGRVVFVRHALPGERVRAQVTEGGDDARYWRADAVEVIVPSAHRVAPRCPAAVPGGCGGCDWQHVDLAEQRRLKAAVVAEQVRRLAGIDIATEDVDVRAVPGDDAGLGWRTRVRLAVGEDGRAGLRRHRSHEVVPLADCPLAHPGLHLGDLLRSAWPAGAEVAVTGGSDEEPTIEVAVTAESGRMEHHAGPAHRREVADARSWRVTGSGFWQVHPGAADALVDAVRAGMHAQDDETVLDLYGGVGLFAGSLVADVAPGGRVIMVEAGSQAVADARHNLARDRSVRVVRARVDRWLRGRDAPRRVDGVVLDPPRSGAGRAVCEAVARLRPRRIVYVACDPAALARDLRTFADRGYGMVGLTGFDIFPMTHHVECVASLQPIDPQGRMVAARRGTG